MKVDQSTILLGIFHGNLVLRRRLAIINIKAVIAAAINNVFWNPTLSNMMLKKMGHVTAPMPEPVATIDKEIPRLTLKYCEGRESQAKYLQLLGGLDQHPYNIEPPNPNINPCVRNNCQTSLHNPVRNMEATSTKDPNILRPL